MQGACNEFPILQHDNNLQTFFWKNFALWLLYNFNLILKRYGVFQILVVMTQAIRI